MRTPIVLLHGFLGSKESWRRVLEVGPAKDAEVYCLDLPGHGLDWNARSFEVAIERLGDLIWRRYFQVKVLIAGYSLGARLALGLLGTFSGFFSGGLLIGLSAGISGAERQARVEADARLARLLREEGIDAFLEHWRSLPLFASQLALPQGVLAEQRRINRSHDPEQLAATLEALSLGRMADYRPFLPRLARPIDLMVGEKDAKFLALAQEMQTLLPNARLEVVPGVGHNVVLEAPAAVSAALGRLDEREFDERPTGH